MQYDDWGAAALPTRPDVSLEPEEMDMKFSCLFAAALVGGLGAAPAAAQHGPVGHYTARLSAQDHFNSNGERLQTVAAILRQDRANYHRFGRGDEEDQGDPFFRSAANRAALERLVARGRMVPGAAGAIINSEPLVHVDIYESYVVVSVL